jgi:hypothetical protein
MAWQDRLNEAAQAILAQAGALNTWRESNFEALGETDTGESYQQWQEAASLCAGFLVQISFTLAHKRISIITSVIDRLTTVLCGVCVVSPGIYFPGYQPIITYLCNNQCVR